jgi:hypothetical protein
VPLLAIIVISLLVMAPSLAKGPRYRPDQEWDAGPEAFGVQPLGQGASAPALESGKAAPGRQQATAGTQERLSTDDNQSGGASASW